jgi:hypothetical protein
MPFDGMDFADAAILRAARDGIAVRKRWTQLRLDIMLPSGRAHCVEGWIREVGAPSDDVVRIVARYLFPQLPWHRRAAVAGAYGDLPRAHAVVAFQDTFWRRHETVVGLFDRALARLNPQGHDPRIGSFRGYRGADDARRIATLSVFPTGVGSGPSRSP